MCSWGEFNRGLHNLLKPLENDQHANVWNSIWGVLDLLTLTNDEIGLAWSSINSETNEQILEYLKEQERLKEQITEPEAKKVPGEAS